MGNFFFYLKNKKISFLFSISLIFIAGGASVFWLRNHVEKIEYPAPQIIIPKIEKKPISSVKIDRPKPNPISMSKFKNKGCVADGILSGYGGETEKAIEFVKRSKCYYLHRALETWASPPDFEYATQIMDKIGRRDVVYGMFIAEAIDKKGKMFYPEKNRNFEFSEMCRGGTDNRWGEHTCIPSFEKEEYRDYLKYMTRLAMDSGIQSFLFGQIYYQDPQNIKEKSEIFDIVDDMRKYAKSKGMDIVVGAQTNVITNEKYLKAFDYIEGGVGLHSDGTVEDGPCYSGHQSCWALLWHENFASRAKNVIVHLDWSGFLTDDMSTFARMEKSKRAETLKNLHAYFSSKNVGFMLPAMATIHRQNGGCYGPKKRFYWASNDFSCKDEDVINEILK